MKIGRVTPTLRGEWTHMVYYVEWTNNVDEYPFGLPRICLRLNTIKMTWPKRYASTIWRSTALLVPFLLRKLLQQFYGCQQTSFAPCAVRSPAHVGLFRTNRTIPITTETLMYHTNNVHNLAYVGLPYTIQGLNSIACQGVNGETSLFGDALWLVDFPLWAAAHFDQGLNYRDASW
ncbi:putative beta-glucuronidase [Penicillium digitatum]|uniref:Putative beta-glucuronidase n=1 Tax=Penicillium digitatum TaxID=36651 RepID=A0A7T6XSM8_PENDI|nr:putative beta-glucuronidase [Penicillium digitatum]